MKKNESGVYSQCPLASNMTFYDSYFSRSQVSCRRPYYWRGELGRSTAANGSILSMTIPVLMTVMGVFMLKEKLTCPRIIALFLGLAGTLLISTDDLRHASFRGDLLVGNIAIFCGRAWGKRLLQRLQQGTGWRDIPSLSCSSTAMRWVQFAAV